VLKNHLKIAWRNLWKNKGYSALNIFGLAIGITCASLILLWVEDELSFDSTFPKQDVVYYVPTHQKFEGEWRTVFQSTPGPLAKVMKDEIPEVVKSSRSLGADVLFQVGDNTMNKYGRIADADFLSIFSLDFIEGNLDNALEKPDAIVISEETAIQLYGASTSALGKTVTVNNDMEYTVTGVFKNLPSNVSYPFDWVSQFERFAADKPWMFEYDSFFSDTFVELSPEADFKTVDSKVRQLLPAIRGEEDAVAFLHTMNDWYLQSNFEGGKKVGGQITYVRLFAFIAIIILMIACINFMNLSTARSEKRANEVGVRKVLGSIKGNLVSQFMAEALITAIIAGIISVVLLLLLTPQFNGLVEKQLGLRLFDPIHILSLIGITLVCGLLAGWYPAFYLSSFKPVEVLKGVCGKQGSAAAIRKGLVITQFAVSIIFIISTIIVYQQTNHVKSRELGFEKENLIRLPVNGDVIKNFMPIQQDMMASGDIENVGLNNSEILSGGNNGWGFTWQGSVDTEDIVISKRYISSSFFETAGMKILEGRGFKDDIDTTHTNILITETFAKLMGEGSAVGKMVRRDKEAYTVIGVVQDYVYGDMYGTGDPVMFFNDYGEAQHLYVKVKPGVGVMEALATAEDIMKTHNPAFPFEYQFVDDAFNARFRSEKFIGNLSQIFALLAIIISCLGLFGLAAYTTEQRRKEIGVRKVLGSSVEGIVRLLSKDFMRLVIIAVVIAGPIAWWVMQNWLERFAYRIQIDWWVFVIAGLVATGVALLTVSFQAIKAAIVNPIQSIRTE